MLHTHYPSFYAKVDFKLLQLKNRFAFYQDHRILRFAAICRKQSYSKLFSLQIFQHFMKCPSFFILFVQKPVHILYVKTYES